VHFSLFNKNTMPKVSSPPPQSMKKKKWDRKSKKLNIFPISQIQHIKKNTKLKN